MTDGRIRPQVERSSLGTPQAKAARQTIPTSSAARVLAIPEAQRLGAEAKEKLENVHPAMDHARCRNNNPFLPRGCGYVRPSERFADILR